jgi:hypothetical protein
VTTTKAVPCSRASASISSNTVSAVPRSRLPVGSSASTQAGRVTSARAIATRWRSPPDSCAGWCARARPAHLRQHAPRAWRAPGGGGRRRMRSGIATLSSALNSGSRWWNW